MMKIYTSYFYMVRFMKPYHIPISSAIYDPKWYNNFKGKNHKWIDKNGVINGINYESLNPGPQHEDGCHGREGCKFNPSTCKFIKEYHEKIFSLDKQKVLNDFQKLCNLIKDKLKLSIDPEIIILVHEDPTNPCSERIVLQEFFNCKEWSKDDSK